MSLREVGLELYYRLNWLRIITNTRLQ